MRAREFDIGYLDEGIADRIDAWLDRHIGTIEKAQPGRFKIKFARHTADEEIQQRLEKYILEKMRQRRLAASVDRGILAKIGAVATVLGAAALENVDPEMLGRALADVADWALDHAIEWVRSKLAGTELEEQLYFKGSPCTIDCSGHRAGYEWYQRKRRTPNSWSPSFNNGAAIAAAGK